MPKVIRRARRCGRHSAVLALVAFGASALVLFMFLESPSSAHPPTPDQFEALPPQQQRRQPRVVLPPMQPVQAAAAAALRPRSFEAHPPVETTHLDSLGRSRNSVPETRPPTAMPSAAPTFPTGWTKHHDAKSGRDYWFNHQSGVSTWGDPTKPHTASPTNAPTSAPTAASHLTAQALPPQALPLPPQSSTTLKTAATIVHIDKPALPTHETAPLTPNQQPIVPPPLLPAAGPKAGGPNGRLAQPAAAGPKPVSDYETAERRKQVVSAMQHAWGGYKECAWGECCIGCMALNAQCARR